MPTIKQKKAFKKVVENGGNVSKAMKDADYSAAMAKNPHKLTKSKGWQEMMDTYLPEKLLAEKHRELLDSTRVDHMVFPLGPKEDEESDEETSSEHTALTDGQIKEMLASVNCTVRKIVHGQSARHVYFWTANDKARKDALDMAYKLRGNYAPEKKEFSGALLLSQIFDESDDNKK